MELLFHFEHVAIAASSASDGSVTARDAQALGASAAAEYSIVKPAGAAVTLPASTRRDEISADISISLNCVVTSHLLRRTHAQPSAQDIPRLAAVLFRNTDIAQIFRAY